MSDEPPDAVKLSGNVPLRGNADTTKRASAPPAKHTDPLRGVRGWLLLFCIITTILRPLLLILTPLPANLTTLGLVILCAMTVLSVFTGISLWGVTSDALMWAKIYLVASLGVLCLELLGGLVRRPNPVGPLVGIATTLAWLAYFMKSKRVRATFGSNLRRPRWL